MLYSSGNKERSGRGGISIYWCKLNTFWAVLLYKAINSLHSFVIAILMIAQHFIQEAVGDAFV